MGGVQWVAPAPPAPLARTHCSCPRCPSSPGAGRPVRCTRGRSRPGRRRCAGRSPRSCRPGTRTSVGRQGPWVPTQDPEGAPRATSPAPAPHGAAHLVEGLGVHGGMALLEHRALLHQHRTVGLRAHLWGADRRGSPVRRGLPPTPQPSRTALTVELAHGAGVGLTLERGWAVPCPPGVHEERGGALGDAHAGREVVRRVPVEVAAEPWAGRT